MKKAIFLDRDGVLIKDVHYLVEISQVKFVKKSMEAVRIFNSLNFLVIGVSNQSVVARGLSTEQKVAEVNEYIINYYRKNNALIEKIYFCPHHQEGKVKKYKKKCECRKPKPGLLIKASKDLKINLKSSIMVGDKPTDVLAGMESGCKTVLLRSEYWKCGDLSIKPNYIFEDLLGFANHLKKTNI